jgi:hypothetical protein
MAHWTFFGKLHPERIPISLGTPLEGNAVQALTGFAFDFRLAVHSSQLIVDVSFETGDLDIFSLRNLAADIARSFADLVGYLNGFYLDVEIHSAVEQATKAWQIFGIDIPVLTKRKSTEDREIKTDLLIAIAASPAAGMVLSDFRRAMRDPVGTGFYCYRAIETMMQSMKMNDAEKDAAGWAKLRSNLNVDRSAIDWIKRHADLPRHGKPSGISDADRATTFELTDEIIKRFHTFLLGLPLPVDKFPTLSAQP